MQITLKRANHTSFKSTRQTSPETGLVAFFFHQVQHWENVHRCGDHNREARQIHLPRSKISAAGRPVTCEPAATACQRDLAEGAGLAS